MSVVLTYPYLVVSDVHFHAWDFGSYITTDGVNSRLQDTINEFKRAAAVLQQQGGTCIVITGDLFHTRGEIKPSVYNPVYDMFKQLSDEGFDVHAIPGNHDLETEETTEEGNCFKSFASLPNFHIYYEKTVVYFESYLNRDQAIFIPWTNNFAYELHKMITATHSDYQRSMRKTIFAHAGLTGVVTGVKATISAEDFNKLEGLRYAFCGHFHNHKQFDLDDGFQQSTVYSVGALTHQSFKDVGSRAGFIIVESPEKVKFHNSEAPEFVDYDADDWGTSPPKEKYQNNYVRMKFKDDMRLTKAEVSAIKISLESVGALRVLNRVDIDNSFTDAMVEKAVTSPLAYVFGTSATLSVSEQFTNYVKARYDKAMADNMIAIFEKDGIDEH